MSNRNAIIASIAEAVDTPIEGISPTGYEEGHNLRGVWVSLPEDASESELKRELAESKLAINSVTETTVNDEVKHFHVEVISVGEAIGESHRCPVCQTPAEDKADGAVTCSACTNVFAINGSEDNDS